MSSTKRWQRSPVSDRRGNRSPVSDRLNSGIPVDRLGTGRALRLALVGVALVFSLACSSAVQQAVKPVYLQAKLDQDVQVFYDVAYVKSPQADAEKHRLDLFVPSKPAFADDGSVPVMVFAHGGSLLKGDKSLEVAGLDFYRNIGRFYSARGIAVATVNYRLQPEVTGAEQVADVAKSVRWVKDRVRDFLPGEPRSSDVRLFLAGHSAGAWLMLRVALDPGVRLDHGLDGAIDGVISISGSGFEMSDQRTWELYPKVDLWAERFAVPEPQDWKVAASVVPLVPTCGCSPSEGLEGPPLRLLLLYSNHENLALVRQNRLLSVALEEAGLEHRVVGVSSGSHRRTMMAMSHPRKIVAREILALVHTNRLDLAPIRQEQVLEELGRD